MPPTHMFAHHRGGQRQPTPGNIQRPHHPSLIIPSHLGVTHTPNSHLDLDLHPALTSYPPGRHCQGVKASSVAWPNAKALYLVQVLVAGPF